MVRKGLATRPLYLAINPVYTHLLLLEIYLVMSFYQQAWASNFGRTYRDISKGVLRSEKAISYSSDKNDYFVKFSVRI